MKRSKKLNRVSWASGVNLCQVKLFQKEDSPAQVGMKSHNPHQLKSQWTPHSNGTESGELPPGFEDCSALSKLKTELHPVPQIGWRTPPAFAMSHNWYVVAGEESNEAGVQKMREQSFFEAVYPRSSAIPLNPTVSLDVEQEHYDDRRTLRVPITPIEDEEAVDVPNLEKPVNTPKFSHPTGDSLVSDFPIMSTCNAPTLEPCAIKKPTPGVLPNANADVILAASTALAALLKSQKQGSLIDTDLLIKILGDPTMIEKLTKGNGANAAGASMVTSNSVSGTSNPLTDLKLTENLINHQMPSSNVFAASKFAALNPITASVASFSPVTPSRNMYQTPTGQQSTTVHSQLSTTPAFVSKAMIMPSLGLPISEPNVNPSTPSNQTPYSIPDQTRHSLNPAWPLSNCSTTQNMLPDQSNPLTPQSTFTARPNPFSSMLHRVMTTQPNQVSANPVKDRSYIKNLIREHGEQKQENHNRIITQNDSNHDHLKMVGGLKHADSKTKYQKPCMYFSSRNGCRRGSNCPYQHDMSFQCQAAVNTWETPRVKKMKLSG